MRRAISVCCLIVAVVIWSVFLSSVIAALVLGRETPLETYMGVSVIVHFIGVFFLPVLAGVSFFLSRPRQWLPLALTTAYLLTTLLIYPQLVERYLATHPGSSGWHWMTGSWCDYQYVAVHPIGDPQYAGQVSLFPPYFDIPPNDIR